MTIDTLRSLQKRIREATGPDREIDADIAEHVGGWKSYPGDNWIGPHGQICVPYFTSDPDGLGACVALMRTVLPGSEWEINTLHGNATVWVPLNGSDGPEYARRPDGNVCLAVLDAIFAAVIAEEQAKQQEKAG